MTHVKAAIMTCSCGQEFNTRWGLRMHLINQASIAAKAAETKEN
jgi:hypothetical protein